MLTLRTFASIHGKLLGGGVAFALAADWRACSKKTTLTFGILTRGISPLFMLSRALSMLVGRCTAFQIYLEDGIISSV